MQTEEIWKPIPGFEFYEASNIGRVRSLDRDVRSENRFYSGTRTVKGRILKQSTDRNGYPIVAMSKNKRSICHCVHQIVSWAFHGFPSDGQVVDHLNGDKTDNRPENLEYVTRSENLRRAHKMGLYPQSCPDKPMEV